jgi:hypothetical protein
MTLWLTIFCVAPCKKRTYLLDSSRNCFRAAVYHDYTDVSIH